MRPLPLYSRLRARLALAQGEKKAGKGDAVAAMADFARAVTFSAPDHPDLERLAHDRSADVLTNQARPAQAVPHLRRLIAMGEDGVDVWRRLAQSLDGVGDSVAAAEAWERVATAEPQDLTARRSLERIYAKTKQPQRRLTHIRALAEADPTNALVWTSLAQILEQLQDDQAAVEAWTQVLAATPGDDAAIERIADLLLKLGRTKEAIPHLEWIASSRPFKPKCWKILAQAQQDVGEAEEALKTWGRVLRLSPAHPVALNASARLLLDAERPLEALPHLRGLTEVSPESAKAWNRLARVLEQVGEHDGTAAALSRSLEIRPDQADVRERLVGLLIDLGRPKEVVEHLRALIAERPERLDLRVAMARVIQEVDAKDAAAEAWRKVIKIDAKHLEAHEKRGLLLLELRREAEAIPHLTFVAQRTEGPEAAAHWRRLVLLHRQAGEAVEEAMALERLLAFEPSDSDHERLGALLIELGRNDEAPPHLLAAAELGPPNVRRWKRLARLRLDLQDEPGEIAAWQRLLDVEPDNASAHSRLADLFWARRDLDAATPHLRSVAGRGQSRAKDWRRLGQALTQVGQDEFWDASSLQTVGELHEEISVWKQILALDGDDREACRRLAELFWEMNRKAEAAPYLERLVHSFPREVKTWRRLAMCMEESGDHGRESDALRRVVALDPEDEKAGLRLKELGRRRRARSDAGEAAQASSR